MKYIAGTAALLAAVALAGCSAGGPSGLGVSLGFGPGTYVGTDRDSVTMLTVTKDSSGNLTGTMTAKNVGQSPWTTGTSISVSGNTIKLSFHVLGTDSSMAGTIQGSDLHMQVPQPDGTVEDYILYPGSVDQYNKDVVNFQ